MLLFVRPHQGKHRARDEAELVMLAGTASAPLQLWAVAAAPPSWSRRFAEGRSCAGSQEGSCVDSEEIRYDDSYTYENGDS